MPDKMAGLPDAVLLALCEHIGALRHDLGKYIALQSRNSTDIDDLASALRSDLLATRRSPSGAVDAAELWAALSPPLRAERDLAGGVRVDLRGDETFDQLQAAMDAICTAIERMRASRPPDDELMETAERAREVASLCGALWRRALQHRASRDGGDG